MRVKAGSREEHKREHSREDRGTREDPRRRRQDPSLSTQGATVSECEEKTARKTQFTGKKPVCRSFPSLVKDMNKQSQGAQ